MRYRDFGLLGVAWVLAGCATPRDTGVNLADALPDAGEVTGPLHVTLLGDYVGRHLRLDLDGTVLIDERLTFPPAGAEHRYTVGWGAARTSAVRAELEGCDGPWSGELDLEPSRSAHLLIQGCEVRALAPD